MQGRNYRSMPLTMLTARIGGHILDSSGKSGIETALAATKRHSERVTTIAIGQINGKVNGTLCAPTYLAKTRTEIQDRYLFHAGNAEDRSYAGSSTSCKS